MKCLCSFHRKEDEFALLSFPAEASDATHLPNLLHELVVPFAVVGVKEMGVHLLELAGK